MSPFRNVELSALDEDSLAGLWRRKLRTLISRFVNDDSAATAILIAALAAIAIIGALTAMGRKLKTNFAIVGNQLK